MYLERKVAGFEMAVENICKFFKFGHCKFGQTCYNQHINELCENRSCEISSCVKRHPSKCKYFNIYKRCKFGEFCSFLHVESRNDKVLDEKVKSLEADVESLKNKMIILKTILQSKENDIKNLQISLENLNKDKCENKKKGETFALRNKIIVNLNDKAENQIERENAKFDDTLKELRKEDTIPQLDGTDQSVLGTSGNIPQLVGNNDLGIFHLQWKQKPIEDHTNTLKSIYIPKLPTYKINPITSKYRCDECVYHASTAMVL